MDYWTNGYLQRDDYYRNVARGLVDGATVKVAYGRHTAAGASSGVVWPNGAYAFPPAAGVQLSIASASPNDTAAGTGVRTIEVHYLDANLVPQVEAITLNGTTPVLSVATDVRFVDCMHRVTSGTGITAAGTISASVGAQVYAEISTGKVRCSSSVTMVPAGHRLLVCALSAGAIDDTAAAEVIVEPATPSFDGHDFTEEGVFMPMAAGAFQSSSLSIVLPVPVPFTEGQSFGFIFETSKAATILGSWFGIMEKV